MTALISIAGSLVAGCVSGFASSSPLGPINLWVAQQTLIGRRCLAFLSGVIVIDVFYASIAWWGHANLLDSLLPKAWMHLAGGLLLLGMGLFGLRPPRSVASPSSKKIDQKSATVIGQFLLGASFCGFNPGFLIFWVVIAGKIQGLLETDTFYLGFPFFIFGIAIGDFVWFRTLTAIVRRGSKKASDAWLDRIRTGLSLAFAILGIYFMYRGLGQLLS